MIPKVLFALITMAAVIYMSGPSSSAILTFEFAVTLPDYPSRMAWSPKNDLLAVTQFNAGEVLLIDVANRRLTDQVVARKIHDPIMAWSPDAHFIALNGSLTFALVSVGEWKLVAERPQLLDGCRLQHSRSLGFEPDSQGIWASCLERGASSEYTAALKMRVPTLAVEDHLKIGPPVPSALANNSTGDYIISDNQVLLLSSIVVSCAEKKESSQPKCDSFIYGYDLRKKSQLFPPFGLKDDAKQFRVPDKVRIAHDGRLAVVGWTPPAKQAPHGPTDIRLETFSTRTGAKIAAYGGPGDVQQLAISDYSLSRSGSFVIGALSDLSTRAGGVRVWDSATGKLLQEIQSAPASFVELSSDGARLAVVVLKEVRVFRVTD